MAVSTLFHDGNSYFKSENLCYIVANSCELFLFAFQRNIKAESIFIDNSKGFFKRGWWTKSSEAIFLDRAM